MFCFYFVHLVFEAFRVMQDLQAAFVRSSWDSRFHFILFCFVLFLFFIKIWCFGRSFFWISICVLFLGGLIISPTFNFATFDLFSFSFSVFEDLLNWV